MFAARSVSCLSRRSALYRNSVLVGISSPRFWSHTAHVRLLGGQRYIFQCKSWARRRFALLDANEQVLAECRAASLLTSWEIDLSDGPAQFRIDGLFSTKYKLWRGGQLLATASRWSVWGLGWRLEGDGLATLRDEITVGLLYSSILLASAAN